MVKIRSTKFLFCIFIMSAVVHGSQVVRKAQPPATTEEKRLSPVQVQQARQILAIKHETTTYARPKKNNLFSAEESLDFTCRLSAFVSIVDQLCSTHVDSPDAAGIVRRDLLYDTAFRIATRYLSFLKEKGYVGEKAFHFDPTVVVESAQLDDMIERTGCESTQVGVAVWRSFYEAAGSCIKSMKKEACSDDEFWQTLYCSASSVDTSTESEKLYDRLTDLICIGNVAAVKKLLPSISEVNKQDCFGNTPLMYAVVFGNEEIMALLLANKASPNIENTEGIVPLLLCDEQRINQEKGVVIRAIPVSDENRIKKQAVLRLFGDVKSYNKKVQAIKELLKKAGASFDAVDEQGNSLLARAAFNGHTTAVQAYIDHGANVLTKNKSGQNALLYALNNFNYFTPPSMQKVNNCLRAIIKQAKQTGKINELINQVDTANSCTALNYASQRCRCAFGTDSISSNPLCMHTKMIDTLRDLGAKTYNQLLGDKQEEQRRVQEQKELKEKAVAQAATAKEEKARLKREAEAAEEKAKQDQEKARREAKKQKARRNQAKKDARVSDQQRYEQEKVRQQKEEAAEAEKKAKIEQELDEIAEKFTQEVMHAGRQDAEYHAFVTQFKRIFDQFDRGYDDPEIFKQRTFLAYKQYLKDQYNISSYRTLDDKDMLYVLCQISKYCADEIRKLNVIHKAAGSPLINVYSTKVKPSPIIDSLRLHNQRLEHEYEQEFKAWCVKHTKDATDAQSFAQWCSLQQFCA